MRRTALLLLACPRSGASALAAALAHAGAYAGRTFVAGPAGGHHSTWQSAALAAFNERLLATLGTRWDSLAPLPERWRERASIRALADEADALIAGEYGPAEHALLHEPRLALTAPFWRERLEAAGFAVGCVLLVRRPAEVAASFARLDPCAPEKLLALWLHYLIEAEEGSRGGARALLTFDRLLDAPAGAIAHVVADTRFGLRIERTEREAALAAIRPELRHFGDGRAIDIAGLSSGIDAVLEDGYQQLARLTPGADPRRAVDAVAQAAQPALLQSIPPWLAQELAQARAQCERLGDALREAAQHHRTLTEQLDGARAAEAAARERSTALARELEELMRPRGPDGRDARVDEALAQLKLDMARVATTLADQPEREHRLLVENAQLQRDLADERTTIAKLSETVEQERSVAEQLAAELASARATLETLATEVEHLRTAERAWKEHGDALAQDLDTLREAHATEQSGHEAMRRERDEAVTQLAKLKEDLDTARTDLRIVDNDRNALAARAQAVSDAAAGLREELGRRSASEAALAAERDQLVREVQAQTARAETLERDLGKRNRDLSTLSGRHESLGRTLAAVERSWLGRRALAGVRRNGRS